VRGLVQQGGPVRPQPPHGEREHQQREAEEAEHVLQQGEPHAPQHQPHREPGERHQQQVVDAAHELQRQRDAADLGDERQQRDRHGAGEVEQAGAGAEALAHEVERRAAGDRRDPSGHLREHHDAEDADHHDPGEAEPEPGADERVRHQVADVHEPADRRQDAEGDREDALHPNRSSSLERPSAADRSSARTPG
jgi:hypothetical protein